MYPVWKFLQKSAPAGERVSPMENPIAKYFHGRADHLKTFRKWMTRAEKQERGTSFLVQGPPGVGKTALLYECRKLAHETGWVTAIISTNALWNPDVLRNDLGKSTKVKLTDIFGELGVMVGGAMGTAKVGGTIKQNEVYTKKILESAKAPLLLILDEAQHLGIPGVLPEAQKEVTIPLLSSIHLGTMGTPVILLAGGLGKTADIFDDLGISRHKDGCLIELHALKKENELAILTDWLVKEGKAKGDVTPWVERIMQETHGWGQHINAYKEAAVDHLQETGGEMNSEGLGLVIAAGAELRRKYYEGRVLKFVAQERRSIARIMTEIPRDGFLEEDDILDSLVKEYGAERGRELFFLSVQKGVFYYNNDRGGYSAPIPSMRDWLMKHFPPKKDFGS